MINQNRIKLTANWLNGLSAEIFISISEGGGVQMPKLTKENS